MTVLSDLIRRVRDVIQDHVISDTNITAVINRGLYEIAGGIQLETRVLSPPLPELYTTHYLTTSKLYNYVTMPSDFQRDLIACNYFKTPLPGIKDQWSETTQYTTGDIVEYDCLYYECVLTCTGVYPDTDPAYWEEIYHGAVGTYNSETAYSAGSVVIYEDEYYYYINSTGASGKTPSSKQAITNLYSALRTYAVGAHVIDENGDYYICIQEAFEKTPADEADYWTQVYPGHWRKLYTGTVEDIKICSFLNMKKRNPFLDETGCIHKVALKGRKLYYQGIPSTPKTIEIHYYKYPDLLSGNSSEPECLPDHLHESLLCNYAITNLFEALEQERQTAMVNPQKYEMDFQKALMDLVSFIGKDEEAINLPDYTDYTEEFNIDGWGV